MRSGPRSAGSPLFPLFGVANQLLATIRPDPVVTTI